MRHGRRRVLNRGATHLILFLIIGVIEACQRSVRRHRLRTNGFASVSPSEGYRPQSAWRRTGNRIRGTSCGNGLVHRQSSIYGLDHDLWCRRDACTTTCQLKIDKAPGSRSRRKPRIHTTTHRFRQGVSRPARGRIDWIKCRGLSHWDTCWHFDKHSLERHNPRLRQRVSSRCIGGSYACRFTAARSRHTRIRDASPCGPRPQSSPSGRTHLRVFPSAQPRCRAYRQAGPYAETSYCSAG